MINKTDLVEVIEGKYISSILEKNPEFSFGKIKYILDIYTRLVVNEVNLEDQQFAVSVLNPKNETGHCVKVGNLLIDIKRAFGDIFALSKEIGAIDIEDGASFKNCALIVSIFTTVLNRLQHTFTKEEFYILYSLYLCSKGLSSEELYKRVCCERQGNSDLYENALSYLEKLKIISMTDGVYILNETVIVQCYI